jgi:hypothetical protein
LSACAAKDDVEKIPINFFYHTSCPSCREDIEETFVDKLQNEILNGTPKLNTVVDLVMYNLATTDGTDAFDECAARYGIPEDERYGSDQYVFIGDVCLVGFEEITQRLPDELTNQIAERENK